jgi:hypothetical protein
MHVAAGGTAALAIPAIDAELARVQRVAVRHRLIRLVTDPNRFRRDPVRDQHDQIDRRAER